MGTMLDRVTEARRELEAALVAREVAESRFQAAVGTSTETGAYERLRRATKRVVAADRVSRRAGARDQTLLNV
jgi:hypothetical protein